MFWQAVTTVISTVVLGLVVQGLGYLVPFRILSARPEIRWDVFAALAALVFAAMSTRFIEEPAYWWLIEIDWIDRAAEATEDWPLWGVIGINFVLADLLAYLAHRLLHSKIFWSMHAWHHAPKYLYWLSGLRSSPGNAVLIALPYVLTYVFFPVPEIGTFAVAIGTFHLLNQHYIHSNLRLPLQRRLEYVFVTPRYHFVHHSANREWTDSNYGFVFSVWDRLFGTYTDPETVPKDDVLGLNYEIGNTRLIIGLPASK